MVTTVLIETVLKGRHDTAWASGTRNRKQQECAALSRSSSSQVGNIKGPCEATLHSRQGLPVPTEASVSAQRLHRFHPIYQGQEWAPWWFRESLTNPVGSGMAPISLKGKIFRPGPHLLSPGGDSFPGIPWMLVDCAAGWGSRTRGGEEQGEEGLPHRANHNLDCPMGSHRATKAPFA